MLPAPDDAPVPAPDPGSSGVASSVIAHQVVVIGGGNAGLSVAGRLRRWGVRDVVVIEPSDEHRYQPMFSHIAGGTAVAADAVRAQARVMPRGVGGIRDEVVSVNPGARTVALASGGTIGYQQLIVCPGIQRRWDAVPGLAEAISAPEVASNYELELAVKAAPLLSELRSGTVVFTQPPGPASCAGAAQKPMYLACDAWRRAGVLDRLRVVLVLPDPTMFGIPAIDRELERNVAEYGIEVRFSSELRGVDAAARTVAIGPVSAPGRDAAAGPVESLEYDVLHVVPPQSAPSWIAESGLAAADDPGGFIEVDPRTLQHPRHPEVWGLGDAAATRNSKSGGALRPQATALARNVVDALRGSPPTAQYDGYSVCPFTVSRGTLVFAEFDESMRQKPTIPFWPGLARERRSTWFVDRHVLPRVYWRLILQGRA